MNRLLLELRRNFVAGLLVVLPLLVTVFVLWRVFGWIFSNFVSPLMVRVVRPVVLWMVPYRLEQAFGSEARVWDILGGIIFVVFILFLGIVARNIMGRRLIGVGEKILGRIPIVGRIYTTVQQIGQAFLGEKRTGFNRVILFEYPRPGLYSFGLVSGEAKGEVQEKTGERVINVFIPTTPNPTSGLLILVPEKDTIPVDMSVSETLRLLVSGGMVTPPGKKVRNGQ